MCPGRGGAAAWGAPAPLADPVERTKEGGGSTPKDNSERPGHPRFQLRSFLPSFTRICFHLQKDRTTSLSPKKPPSWRAENVQTFTNSRENDHAKNREYIWSNIRGMYERRSIRHITGPMRSAANLFESVEQLCIIHTWKRDDDRSRHLGHKSVSNVVCNFWCRFLFWLCCVSLAVSETKIKKSARALCLLPEKGEEIGG